ncbi:MAG: serine/threonine protein kinase, partial [Caulobacteraceae bacterium]|nr:serine/threonine protein kinase [Caulobacter sp.]
MNALPDSDSFPDPDDRPGFAAEGETFGHYQVLRRPDGSLWELGRGAMGVTYKAFDTNLRCHVALKVISADYIHSETAGQRFIREARVAARVRHPHIATVHHLGVDPQGFFYAMEFIDGETLESLVERVGPLGLETTLRIGLQVARALAAASRQGLIHRDIKPANLMVIHQDEDGEDRLFVKMIDF